jgi:SAM-dependent methyltransferase
MHTLPSVTLANVQAVYSGAEGRLWELVMGEQVHLGGLVSSQQLADRAGLKPGFTAVDLCCCNGAGLRFLTKLRGAAKATGVDATETVLVQARERNRRDGVANRCEVVKADAIATGLPDGAFDLVWGEDAWCYVADKAALAREAARLVKRGGTVAFTDWVEGPAGLSAAEAARFLAFMKFPSLPTLAEWKGLLEKAGLRVEVAEDTGRFAPCCELYLNMLGLQLGYDALRCVGFDGKMLEALGPELGFVRDLAQARKLAQGLFVARKV